MTNKLKKEIERNDFGMRYKCKSCKYWKNNCTTLCLDCFNKLIKQAKLSQKQEDDERFEEFIKLLKDCLREGNNPISSDYLREKIDKLAEEIKRKSLINNVRRLKKGGITR